MPLKEDQSAEAVFSRLGKQLGDSVDRPVILLTAIKKRLGRKASIKQVVREVAARSNFGPADFYFCVMDSRVGILSTYSYNRQQDEFSWRQGGHIPELDSWAVNHLR